MENPQFILKRHHDVLIYCLPKFFVLEGLFSLVKVTVDAPSDRITVPDTGGFVNAFDESIRRRQVGILVDFTVVIQVILCMHGFHWLLEAKFNEQNTKIEERLVSDDW